jgi:hypothetical protein
MGIPNHQRKAHPWKGLARALRRFREKNASSRLLEAALKVEHPIFRAQHAQPTK